MKWILLALLLLLLLFHFFFRLGVEVCYDQNGGYVKLRLGPKYVQLWPSAHLERSAEQKRRKQEKKAQKKEKKAKQKTKKSGKPPKERPRPTAGGLLSLAVELLPVVQKAGRRTKERLQIDCLILHLTWGEEDPADAAIHYGRAWGILGWLSTALENQFTIKEKKLSAEVDFVNEQTRLYVRAGLSMTPAQLAAIGLPAAIETGKRLLQKRKQSPSPTGRNGTKKEVPHGKESSGQ